jgi:PAS domain S-box-containing protein
MNASTTVLLLEDNIYDAEIILHELRKQGLDFVEICANNKEQFLEGLKKKPDIILADYSLPHFTASEALKLMHELGYDIPVIAISGMIGEELAVEMMRLGASDYLMKDRLGRLSTAVATALESAELRRINEQYTRELEESNARYKSLFDDSPISLWEEDFSSLKMLLDELTASGITDLRKHFLENPEALDRLCQSRNLISINQATIDLYGASTKQEAYDDLSNIKQDELKIEFMEYALAIYSGEKQYRRQTWHTTIHGEPIYVSIRIALAPNHIETWGRVYISIVDLTEQAKAQQKVAQSESLLSSMVDSSLDWIYVKDKSHRYILANETFADGLNMEKENIIGKKDEEIGFTPETSEKFRQANKRILASGEPETYYNEELKREDGRELHFSTIKTPLYDTNGNPWGVMGISRDISDLLRAEAALAESQQNYESLFNSLVDGMFVHDMDGKILVANPVAHERLGYQPGELVGKFLEDIAIPGPDEPETNYIEQVEKEGHITFKTRHRAKDGTIVPLDVSSNLVEFQGKQAVLAIARDITEIVKAKDDLEQSEKLLRAVINSSPDSILVKDRNQVISLANQATADDLGVTPEFMIGKTDVELGYSHDQIYGNPEKELIGFRELDKVVFEQGKEAHQVIPFMLEGELNYFDAYEIPLRDAEGNITSALVYSRNITEIIQAQKDLEQSEALLRSIFDSSPDWIFVKDKDHRYILVNTEFVNGIGYPESEIIGKTDFDLGFPAEAAEQFQQDDKHIIETGKPMLFDDVLVSNKKNKLAHYSTMKSPLIGSDGEIWGIMGIARDISERLERESELNETRKNFASVFTSLVDTMLIYDLSGNILVANPAAQKMFGYTPEELTAKTIQELSAPENAEEQYQIRLNQLKEFGQIKFNARQFTKENTVIPVEVTMNLVEFGGEPAVLSIMHDISDVREAEEALEKSEEQYRSLFDTVPDIIILCESNGNILHVNQAVVTLSGYSYEELTTKHISELITEGGKLIVNPEEEGLSTKNRVSLTMEITTNQDESRLLDINIRETLFNGYPVTMLVGRDQTDRILAERKTQETEGLLRTMIDTIPQPIFVFDEDGYYVMANQNIAELFQTEQENIIGKSNAELAKEGIISPDEAVIYHENAMIPLMTRESYFRPVDSYTDRDGIKHWFQIYTTPFRLPDGSMWVVGVGNEITHQMQAQNRLEAMNEALERRVEERTRDLDTTNVELQKAKEQLESILSHSPDGFLLLDADLNIQVMNPAFSNIIGVQAESNVGKNVMLTVGEKNRELIGNSIQQAIETHKSLSIEHKATHLDGREFDCLTSISPIYSEDLLVGLVIGVHDITPQKEVQRMKDAFVSNVSHELRTPITNFICNMELIRMNPQKQDVYLERLDLEIVQLKNIIEDLLRLSRFDQNATDLNRTPFDINAMCREFSSLRTPLAEQKQLSMAFIPHEPLPKVFGDYGLISQVLSILLTNAINYTQNGGEILIRSHPEDEAHPGMVGFSVTDNGPGISLEEKERLFERFFRGNAGINSQVAGTGLGLPIAHEIIERHQGDIEVFSRGIPGDGTSFFIWLPINTGEDID